MINHEYTDRKLLQQADWNVTQTDSVEFNYGSETITHFQTKCAAAWVLREKGYRINSEVEMGSGTVDLLGYGRPDGDIVVVECETSPTTDVITDKVNRYTRNEPPRECFVINCNDCPTEFLQSIEWVRNQL